MGRLLTLDQDVLVANLRYGSALVQLEAVEARLLGHGPLLLCLCHFDDREWDDGREGKVVELERGGCSNGS